MIFFITIIKSVNFYNIPVNLLIVKYIIFNTVFSNKTNKDFLNISFLK